MPLLSLSFYCSRTSAFDSAGLDGAHAQLLAGLRTREYGGGGETWAARGMRYRSDAGMRVTQRSWGVTHATGGGGCGRALQAWSGGFTGDAGAELVGR